MARSYIVFGDVEGKLDMLRVECTQCERKGRYSVLKLIQAIRAQGQPDEMDGDAQQRLPEARCGAATRALRLDLPRSADGAIANA